MQEILVIVAIGLAVIFIPRLMNRNRMPESRSAPHMLNPSEKPKSRFPLTGWIRMIIVLSILWITGCAAYLQPWNQNTFLFFCISFGPVLVLWGGIWVRAGYIKYRR